MNKLSEREIFERSITEEDVFGACRTLLELNGAHIFRLKERVPHCIRNGCGHFLSDHRGWHCRKCACFKFKGSTSEPGLGDATGWFYRPPFEHPGLVCPIHFWIEFKRPYKAVYRPAQMVWINNAVRDGVIAMFANSVEQMVEGFARFGIKLKGAL